MSSSTVATTVKPTGTPNPVHPGYCLNLDRSPSTDCEDVETGQDFGYHYSRPYTVDVGGGVTVSARIYGDTQQDEPEVQLAFTDWANPDKPYLFNLDRSDLVPLVALLEQIAGRLESWGRVRKEHRNVVSLTA